MGETPHQEYRLVPVLVFGALAVGDATLKAGDADAVATAHGLDAGPALGTATDGQAPPT